MWDITSEGRGRQAKTTSVRKGIFNRCIVELLPMSLRAGNRVGSYEIVSLIGSGAMGEVYCARDARLRREIAIKVLPAAFAKDAERMRRFELEAQAAGRLNHPNVLAIYDVGMHEGSPYLVSELLEGESLRSRLSGGKLSPHKAVDYAR